MYQVTRCTQTGLDSISEDNESVEKEPEIEFRDYFGKKQLKKTLMIDTREAPIDEYSFLKKNYSIMGPKEQKSKLEAELQQKRDEQTQLEAKKNSYDIFHGRVYEDRNPAIKSLIKDVRANSGINQLADDLKKEFDMFLTTSVINTTESIKNYSRSGSSSHKANEGVFLTQDEELDDFADEEIDNVSIKVEKPELIVCPNRTGSVKSSSNQLALIEKKSSKNLQVAVVDDEKNSEVIKLNKMIAHIKRIDLPKFQPELHQICQYGSDVKLLDLYSDELGGSLNKQTNGLGRFCIHECCVKGNVKMLKGMLPYIDDINKVDNNQQTAAHVAAKFDELECLKILYANGINIELPDKFGVQVAHIAAQQDHTDIIEFLFDIGVSFNTSCNHGKIPIHYAAEFGSYEALKILTKYYVDISMVDNDQNTIGHLAAKNDHLKCIQYLIKLGFPVDIVRNNHGRNIAHQCCVFGATRTLHWLFRNGIDKEILDDYGNNLAASSCINGQAECFNCCIQHDVPVNTLNYQDETPLDIARKCGKSCHIEKSANNQIRCTYCVENAIKVKIEKESQSQLAGPSTLTFDSAPIKHKHKRNQRSYTEHNLKSGTNLSVANQRDFIAQYFGPEI